MVLLGLHMLHGVVLRAPERRFLMTSARLSETESIKRLLVLFLLKIGASSEEIGLALDVNSSLIRRMFPAKAILKIKGPK